MTTTYCQFSEDQIKESGLLSPDRMAAVSAAIDARIVPCCLPDGTALKNALIADHGNDGRFVYTHCDETNHVEYMRRSCLPAVLTAEELEFINKACSNAREARLDAERFAKAEKVEQWGEGAWLDDRYFSTMDELIEQLEDGGDEWPEYVWAAKGKAVIHKLHVADVVENQISDSGWEDMEISDLNGVTELQQALDKFVEANAGVESFLPDYSTAILTAAWRQARTPINPRTPNLRVNAHLHAINPETARPPNRKHSMQTTIENPPQTGQVPGVGSSGWLGLSLTPELLRHFPKPCRPRKTHRCRLCAGKIEIGEQCCKWEYLEPGEGYGTSHSHPECYQHTLDAKWDEGDWECMAPGDIARPNASDDQRSSERK